MVELKKNIVLVGGGGHCISVIDIIENGNEFNILGILDPNSKENNLLDYKILGGDNLIPELVNENTYFLITVGQIKSYSTRKKIAKIKLHIVLIKFVPIIIVLILCFEIIL